MGRKILAVVVGVFVAGIVILAVEAIGHAFIVAQRNGEPTTAMLFWVAMAWLFGAAAGCLVTQRVDHSRRPVPALVTGGILLVLTLANLVMLPHPVWFRVLGVLVLVPGVIAGIHFGRKRQRPRKAADA